MVICDSRPGNSREFHLFCLEFGKMRASEFFLKLKWWMMYFWQSRDASLAYLQARLWLGINQSATALDGVSAAPGKHMLHMCRKSLVINLFFSQISGFYTVELRWVSKMFVHCIKPSSSIMYNVWNGQMVAVENLASIAGHNMAAMFQLW